MSVGLSSDGPAWGGGEALLPAPGFRDAESGKLGGVGSNGYSWSTSFYDTDDYYRGLYLRFFVVYLNHGYAGSRDSGFQLRCLSE